MEKTLECTDQRYKRNIPALSEEECSLLRTRRVFIAGCGGLGGHLAELMARIGIGAICAVDGDVFEWDYEIVSSSGEVMATVSKELFNFTDTYVMNIKYPQSALHVLMLVLAIDAEKDSRN